MKRFALVAILLTLMSALFATSYIIDSYNFIFEDSTDLSVVYSKLGLKDYTSFESYEELEEYVKAKEQEIANWEIFNGTDSSIYEVEAAGSEVVESETAGSEATTEKHYIAVFEINDKNPLFVFPTPKYDSNTGLSLGVKMDSKNFAGKLASFTTKLLMEQKDNSFETATYSLNLSLTKLPIANFNMDTSLAYEYDGAQNGFLKGSSLVFGVNIYDIKLWDTVTFKLNTSIKLNPTNNELGSFGFDKVSYSATIANLFMQQGGIDLTHGMTYYPRKGLIETNYKISYFGFTLKDRTITTSIDLLTTNKRGGGIIDVVKKELVAIPFVLPLNFNFTPSLTLKSSYETNGNKDMKDWSVVKEIILAASFSRYGINKVIDGNQDFRTGISFSIYASRAMYLSNLLEESSQYATLSLSYFPFATSWFNPSIRITGIVSKLPTRGLFEVELSDDTTTMAEYMRGIRNNNKYNTAAWNAMVVTNINLTTKCINLGSWARTYAIAFVDFAYLSTFSNESSKWLCALGIEGIGIINNHSNYPVRASLGFNAESLKTFAETKDFEDLEYEIFFGLGYFY